MQENCTSTVKLKTKYKILKTQLMHKGSSPNNNFSKSTKCGPFMSYQ